MIYFFHAYLADRIMAVWGFTLGYFFFFFQRRPTVAMVIVVGLTVVTEHTPFLFYIVLYKRILLLYPHRRWRFRVTIIDCVFIRIVDVYILLYCTDGYLLVIDFFFFFPRLRE